MSQFPNEPGAPMVPDSVFRDYAPAHVDMTPATAHRPHRPRYARAIEPERGLWPTIGWTALGTLVPGVGLWRAGHRVAGPVITGVYTALVVCAGFAYFGARDRLADFATQSSNLVGVAIAIALLGLAWVVVIGVSHLALRTPHPTTGERAAGAVAVGFLSLAVMAPAAFGADLSFTVSNAVGSIFGDGGQSGTRPMLNQANPWLEKKRLSVMILGGDHDAGRSASLGSRADTVIVASINTQNGATTLFSLPRQTARMPFPKDSKLYKYFPNGFYDGVDGANPEYMLNAMIRNVPPRVPADILGETSYLPYDIMKISVGEALGLTIDYFVMVDMDGFKDFINAIGGITVNVNQRVPIGGKTTGNVLPYDWIEPGPDQHLSGYNALWYARGRFGLSDYSRMDRQRCVINAVVQQANPANVLKQYNAVASAAKNSITTDIPQGDLPALIDLADRVKGTTLRSIVFQHGRNGFVSGNPDFALMRSQVKKALKETDSTNTPASADPSAAPGASATPSAGATPSTAATPDASASPSPSASATPKKAQSVDVSDACAYNPIAKDPNAGKGTIPRPTPR